MFFKLLSELDHETLSAAFESIHERNELRNLLTRYANYIEWNLKSQQLFLEFDVELEPLERFRIGVVGDYKRLEFEILHHPDSETTDNADANTCYVCQSDEQVKSVMLYILNPKIASIEHPNNIRTPEFNKWLSNPQTNHPGLSADVETFAADILAVHGFYNEHFLEANMYVYDRGPFSIAQKMKKNFAAYHTNDTSATSLAFIIGYRAEMEPMTFTQMHHYMVEETIRRLKRYPQPNIYFTPDQINAWNNLFVAHCEEAMKLIDEETERIEALMFARMRSDHQMTIQPTVNIRQEREKYLPAEHERQIPANLSDYIIEMASRPMLNDRRLRKDMRARVGELAFKSGVNYENRKGNPRDYLNLPHTWIDTICGVIFSRPLKSDFSRYTKTETQELLKEILTSHYR